jgi:long-chain fatty acid transport protein
MKKIVFSLIVFTMTTVNALAGGILTNTNQSVAFLKNPARDAAIGLDGVYSNPAGVVFMPEGFHIAFNWQYAHQTRTITSTNPAFAMGKKNNGPVKEFEGVADAPIIPSLQVAYNKDNWSIQLNLSVPGGGGSCEFANGLGSFEGAVGSIASTLSKLPAPATALGYDMDSYMKGRQYYYGVQVGAAYKVYPNLSVYGGMRMLYGDATYKASISNIQVKTAGGYVDFGDYLQAITPTATALGMGAAIEELNKYSEGVNLLCNQDGVGFAPIVGVDWKYRNFNFAAKYEFKTQIRMKNESTVNKAHQIDAVNKFRDGEKVNEDAPALLTMGAQWTPIDDVRLNIGWHHFFDNQVNWYGEAQNKLKHNTNEFLAGVEWDVTERLNVSTGAQLTRYGLTDEYMNDMSFVTNSYSVGFGFSYKVKSNVTVSAAYFQTMYDKYNRENYPAAGVSDTFTRTNRVLGASCQIDL